MRRAVTQQRQRLGTLRRDDLDRRILVEWKGEIDEAPVNDRRQRRLRQAWRDPAAMSRTGVPAATPRVDPSGNVIWTSLINLSLVFSLLSLVWPEHERRKTRD
jgi:hypothetical protein